MARRAKEISVWDVERIAYELALGLKWEETIPPFSTRLPGRLEGALAAPFQSFGGHQKYIGVAAKAAALFYFMVKDHPFQNGNKRIGLTTILVYLYRNGYWLNISPQALYDLAIWMAASPSVTGDDAISVLTKILRRHMQHDNSAPSKAEKT